MTNPNRTDLVLIIDRSGSMSSIKSDAEGSINSLLEEYKKIPQDVRVTLVDFDVEIRFLSFVEPAEMVKKYVLSPRGMTALYDAIGTTINTIGKEYAGTDESSRPGKVVVVIATDGEENSSREFAQEQIKTMVEHQNLKYNWQFMYIGANQDAYAAAAKMGVQKDMASCYYANTQGVRSIYSGIAQKIVRYSQTNCSTDLNFNEEDKKAQEEANENS